MSWQKNSSVPVPGTELWLDMGYGVNEPRIKNTGSLLSSLPPLVR